MFDSLEALRIKNASLPTGSTKAGESFTAAAVQTLPPQARAKESLKFTREVGRLNVMSFWWVVPDARRTHGPSRMRSRRKRTVILGRGDVTIILCLRSSKSPASGSLGRCQGRGPGGDTFVILRQRQQSVLHEGSCKQQLLRKEEPEAFLTFSN